MQSRIITEQIKENIKHLIEKGQFQSAKDLVQQYQKMVPKDIETYSILGVIAIMEDKMDDAEKILLKGLEIDNNNFDLLFNLGYLYEVKLIINKAISYYKLALNTVQTSEQERHIKEILARLETADNFREKERINCTKGNNIEEINKYKTDQIFTKNLDKEILKDFNNKDFNKIVKSIQSKITNREYDSVIAICNYWFNKVNKKTAIIYYFMGVAANGIKDYDNALKYHIKALELDNSLADLRNRKSKYRYGYEETTTLCIGCGYEEYEIVNISNQSISEDNKELINPIRIWVKCKKCGLIYANPIPSEDCLNKYYSIIAKEKFGGIYGDIDKRFEFLVSMANSRLEKIERYTLGPRSILDIGTGIGIFTGIALDRGWQAEGIELTPEDCRYAKDKFGLELKQENFYSFKDDRKYDVVTLFEVIEHLHHPLEDLKQINKLIKDNGMLLIATPIQDSLYSKKMKESNVFWNVVTHLSYFTKDVMLDYLDEAGFKIVEINSSNEGMGRMEFYCKKI